MRRSDLTLCLITDEVSPSLDEGLAFACAEGIGTVDLRVIDGRNVLALSLGELADAAQRVRAATCNGVTPLLLMAFGSPPASMRQATVAACAVGFQLAEPGIPATAACSGSAPRRFFACTSAPPTSSS